uniref:Uncharacterized protein n=1 Tax=viral metagenome TaxID=1070528 RepID=A0A6C0I4H6_9ZZZZ
MDLSERLENAITDGDLDEVKLLVDVEGADINEEDLLTPLGNACYRGHLEIAQFLISRGAEVNPLLLANSFSLTPLLAVCGTRSNQNNLQIAELLILNGANVNDVSSYDRSSPLHRVCFNGNRELAQFFISNGADVNYKKKTGETPLHVVCDRGDITIALLLLESGANVDSRDNSNQTPLHYASFANRVELIDVLYDYRADLGAKDNHGKTPLHIACARRSLSTVETLLDRRPDIRSIPDSFGNLPIPPCPLLEACDRGYTNIVLWHLSLGGIKDINQGIDSDNNTLIHIASKAGNLQLVNTLLGLGAYPMSRNGDGKTPLQVAREHNHNDNHREVIDQLSSLYSEEDFPPVDHAVVGGATKSNKNTKRASNSCKRSIKKKTKHRKNGNQQNKSKSH